MGRLKSGYYKKANGLLEYRFHYGEQIISVYGRSYADIDEKVEQKRAELDAGLKAVKKHITLDAYYLQWQENRKHDIKASTRYTNDIKYRRITKTLGKKRLDQITVSDVKRLKNELADEMCSTTVNHMLILLRSILNGAVEDKLITYNPAADVKNLKRTAVEKEHAANRTNHMALSHEEQEKFFQYAKDSYYYEYMAFMISTGMRMNEVAALEWSDIDYQANVIHVTKNLCIVGDKIQDFIIDTPKSESSIRDIPLTENTKAILRSQRNKDNILNVSGRIFSNTENDYVQLNSLNTCIKSIIKRMHRDGVQIHDISSHCFRDTFATRCIEQGMNPQTLKVLLGHSKLSMTMDLYAQVLPNTKQEEISKIEIAI